MKFRIDEIKKLCEKMLDEGSEFCEVITIEQDETEIDEETGEPEKGCMIFSVIEGDPHSMTDIGSVDEVTEDEIWEKIRISPLDNLFANIEDFIREQEMKGMENPFPEPEDE